MQPAPLTPSVLVYDRIARNRRMTALLVTIAIVAVVPPIAVASLGVALAAHYLLPDSPAIPWLLGAGVAAVMVAVLGLLFWSMVSQPSSKLLTMIGARPPRGAETETRRLLENLSIGAGLPTPRFYVIDTPVPNACAAGIDTEHSAVAATVGLLALLEHRELEGVLAHELSHIGNHDTRLNALVAAIALFLRIPYLIHGDGSDELPPGLWWLNSAALFGYLLAPVRVYLFFVAPLLAALIRSAVSRNREFLADADAVLLTREPDGLMRALAKIAGAGSAIQGANPSVAHFYFADPSHPADGTGLRAVDLLATHPPISDRIAVLAKLEGCVPESEIAAAVRQGQEYSERHRERPETIVSPAAQGELSVFTAGNPAGRVFRLVGPAAPVPVYDQRSERSAVVDHIMTGDLLVVFDDPGAMREIVTSRRIFGFLPGRAKLRRVDMLPAEVFEPDSHPAGPSREA